MHRVSPRPPTFWEEIVWALHESFLPILPSWLTRRTASVFLVPTRGSGPSVHQPLRTCRDSSWVSEAK